VQVQALHKKEGVERAKTATRADARLIALKEGGCSRVRGVFSRKGKLPSRLVFPFEDQGGEASK